VILGIDPGLHTTALAVYCPGTVSNGPPGVRYVGVICGDESLKNREAALDMAISIVDTDLDLGGWRWTRLVVEGQHLDGRDSKVPPSDLINLSLVSGACVARFGPGCVVDWPLPSTWKGSAKKVPHHEDLCKKLGWTFTHRGRGKSKMVVPTPSYSVPGVDTLEEADWLHVLDAIGLALWAHESTARQDRINKAARAAGWTG